MGEDEDDVWYERVPGGLPVLVVLLLLLPMVGWRGSCEWRLAQAKAAHRAAGLPITEEELS